MNKQVLKNNVLPFLIIFFILFYNKTYARTSETYCITADVINAGGPVTEAESENYNLFGSIGQSVINVPQEQSVAYKLDAGFLYHVKDSSTPDDDDLCFADDNCPMHPNSGDLGTCVSIASGPSCTGDGDCGGGFCSMDQEDTYPPGGNGIGDACECEGNFDCDRDQDSSDAATFKLDFGRSNMKNPCTNELPCNGDFNCDKDADSSDAALFKSDFGRSSMSNPCPSCIATQSWCVYP